jgi:16S rRNA (adenine1518-N6/adenine1519-N6)-dimethyltransferase
MFQKELGEKILGKFPSANYGRISILTDYRLKILKKFLVSPNCFLPKPKVTSLVIHFKPKAKYNNFKRY